MPQHLQVPLALVAGISTFSKAKFKVSQLSSCHLLQGCQRHLYPNPDPDSLPLICLLGPSADPGLGMDPSTRPPKEQPGLQCWACAHS